MREAALLLSLLCACHPNAPVPTQSLRAACTRMEEVHKRDDCAFFDETVFDGCENKLQKRLNHAKPQPAERAQFLSCSSQADSCDGITKCANTLVAAIQKRRPSRPSISPVPLLPSTDPVCETQGVAHHTHRHGDGIKMFSGIATTRVHPIEVCGPAGEHRWIKSARCDDGSSPVYDGQGVLVVEPASLRLGSVGAGGRCGHSIDVYRVSCPERLYELYFDMFMCVREKES